MSAKTITTFTQQETASFENYSDFISARLEDAWSRALAEKMRNELTSNNKNNGDGNEVSVVNLPWGTFTAEVKSKAGMGNVNVSFEPSKSFLEAIKSDDKDDNFSVTQNTFDSEFLELFKDYVAYGFFYPNAAENKDRLNSAVRCLNMDDIEAEYFLNHYANVLVTIAREKFRPGKIYSLQVGHVEQNESDGFPHGTYDFKYTDDGVTVTFVADKGFKQYLKNDAAVVA